MTLDEQKQAARELCRALPPQALLKLLNQQHFSQLHDEESGKTHARKRHRLSAEEWAEYKAVMLDGSGVPDHRAQIDEGPSLIDRFLTALIEDDQATVFALESALVKSLLVQKGVHRTASGGVIMQHGSSAAPPNSK